jgi:hypothetical protein
MVRSCFIATFGASNVQAISRSQQLNLWGKINSLKLFLGVNLSALIAPFATEKEIYHEFELLQSL